MKAWRRNRKGHCKFWQAPGKIGWVVVFLIAIAAVAGGLLAVGIITEGNNSSYCIIAAAIAGGLFFILLPCALRLNFIRVTVSQEKIVVRWLFGKLTECKINEITDVYIVDSARSGNFIVIKDYRDIKAQSYTQKGGSVMFQSSEARLRLVKTFWRGTITKHTRKKS